MKGELGFVIMIFARDDDIISFSVLYSRLTSAGRLLDDGMDGYWQKS